MESFGTGSEPVGRYVLPAVIVSRVATLATALCVLAGCAAVPAVPTPTPTPTPTPSATATPSLTPTPSSTPSPSATSTPVATATPDPYAGLTIQDLAERRYGSGTLRTVETMSVTDAFTRTLVSHPSDDLTVFGFMNEPFGPGPHRVVLVLHGYVNPSTYNTLAYTTRYADALAREGFLVLHPNYRNHPPSDSGDNAFRVGHAIDVLNLIAIVRRTAGQPGALLRADGDDIALFGHSMGGGIALRAVTVDPEVDAAVLYGSTSADDRLNFERWGRSRGAPELDTLDADLQRIAPIYHLQRIEAALSVHHGENDADVPVAWSDQLCDELAAVGRPAVCFTYPGAGHLFWGETDQLFMDRVTAFLNQAFDGD